MSGGSKQWQLYVVFETLSVALHLINGLMIWKAIKKEFIFIWLVLGSIPKVKNLKQWFWQAKGGGGGTPLYKQKWQTFNSFKE